jgi:hypothetical protein
MIPDLLFHTVASINELESFFYVSILRMQLDLKIVPVYVVMVDIPDVALGCLCDERY